MTQTPLDQAEAIILAATSAEVYRIFGHISDDVDRMQETLDRMPIPAPRNAQERTLTATFPPLFIVEDGEIEPFARNLLEMKGLLAMIGRDRAHGFGNYGDAFRVWRWTGAGSTEELTFAVDGPAVFNEDDYAGQMWRLVGPDGTVHVEVCVRIDGRA